MRILLIDVNCKSSSTGQIVYNLYSYYNEHGDNAAICYGRGEKINEPDIYKFGYDWETNLHALLTRITGYTGCFSFFSTKRLIRFIEEYHPDVVHIHELHAYFINIKQLLSYLAKKKIRVVHTLHCEFSYTGKCGHSKECQRWKKQCGKCPHLKDYPATWLFDHTKHMIKTKKTAFNKLNNPVFVAPSTWLLDKMKESFLRDNRFDLIHNSIDTNIFYPRTIEELRAKHNLKYNQKIILAVAPDLMSDTKGGKYVLALSKQMKEYIFILIGAKEEPYVKENIFSLGPVYDKDLLAQYYSLADVFVICSRDENFPTTCVEAVCCGTPVVGFDVGGTKETAPEPVGHFVPYGDVSQIKSEIEKQLDNRIKEQLDFTKIKDHYSLSRMAKDYLTLYGISD